MSYLSRRTCPEGLDRVYGTSFEWKKLYDISVYMCDVSEGGWCGVWFFF